MASKRRRPSAPQAPSSATYAPPPAPPAPEVSPQAPAPSVRPVFHEKDRIGDILRRVREHRGEDLESIADYLRIRPGFLAALEDSHYEELPADAYVIGFLRTYANYLGLDGRGAIDQYRREMAGRRRKPQLSMPQPMSEGRAPTIAVLIGAAVACLFIYGLWYGLSTPDRDVLEKQVPVPVAAEEQPEAAPTPASEALAATPAGDLLLETTTGASAAVSSLAAATATPPAVTAPATNDKQQTPAAADQAKPVPATDAKTTPKEAAPPAEQPAPAAAKTEEKTEAEKPQSFGETGKTRVVVRAEKDSWILVTDGKGLTIFDRTLKPGETYNVPAGKGLSLTTGNVAGVVFSLDGKELPKLPATGRVARGVPLDPDKLKAKLTSAPAAETPPNEDKTEKPPTTASPEKSAD